VNSLAVDDVFISVDRSILRPGAQVISASLQVVFDGQRLQSVRHLVSEVAGDWQLALEKGHDRTELFLQLVLGKPDKVFKTNRHELIAVGNLQVELDSLRGKLKAVGNVTESPGFSQMLAH